MRPRIVVGLIVCALFTAPASAYALGWASQSLSPPAGYDHAALFGVSCTSTSFCIAVGNHQFPEGPGDDGNWYNWNGTTWSTAGTFGTEEGLIRGVSCTSTSFCVAVGKYSKEFKDTTVALHWNGSKWTIISTPNGVAAMLTSVSCTATNACTAVGWVSGSEAEEYDTLALRWNGTSWVEQSTPNPGTVRNFLEGVSCTSSTHCVAVGSHTSSPGGGGSYSTLAITWNGTTWTAQSTPNPTGALSANLRSISCTSSTVCTAVGTYQAANGPLPFAIRWNGTSWSLQSVKLPGETNFGWLYGVSCTSGTFCMAGGAYEKIGKGTFLMAQKWNGSSWTAEKPPSLGVEWKIDELRGVSCVASNWCNAAGDYYTNAPHQTPLISHFSG